MLGANRLPHYAGSKTPGGIYTMKRWFYSRILRMRNRHLFVLDLIVLSLTPLFSVVLRFEGLDEVVMFAVPLAIYTVMSIALKIGAFSFTKLYNRYWHYASVDEVASLCLGTTIAWLLCGAGFFLVLMPIGVIPDGFPRSLPFIDGILTMMLVGGLRLAFRLVYVLNQRDQTGHTNRRALVVGAGIAGSIIVKELRDNPQFGTKPVCFVDDDPKKQGVVIHGVEVVGTLEEIPRLLSMEGIDEVIIAMPAVPGRVLRGVTQVCKSQNVACKTIPSVFEILSGSAVAQLRDVNIEDLLRRGVIEIDKTDIAQLLHGACVMVTGAGGSIGSELCRQIVTFRPKALILLGHGENTIFQIAAELRSRHGLITESVPIHTVIADIRDRDRMDHVFEFYKPEIIFHAAAHKHVGLMEKNLVDAVTNNVLGTRTLVQLAEKHDVKRLVMLSSDKAVNPTSIMGVTKRVAELVVHDAAERMGRNFMVVRFGNVLGSRGSVVPLFRQQIQEGGPIKVTDPEATRFFMTIPEAVQLVLQAGTMGKGGEIFVLDMGEPVKIVDLARDLLRLSGLKEGLDIDIVYFGLQKGEKMHEELFYETERAERSRHEKILVCRNGIDANHALNFPFGLLHYLDVLSSAAKDGNTELITLALRKIVPQYREDEIASERAPVIPKQADLFEASPRSARVG